jgi:hypothetical protein
MRTNVSAAFTALPAISRGAAATVAINKRFMEFSLVFPEKNFIPYCCNMVPTDWRRGQDGIEKCGLEYSPLSYIQKGPLTHCG